MKKLQIDIGQPIIDERRKDVYLLTAKDRFSEYRTADVFAKTIVPMDVHFLDLYIQNQRLPVQSTLSLTKQND